MKTFCRLNCDDCILKKDCSGCLKTQGKPFGELCPIAECCFNKKIQFCSECKDRRCHLRQKLIDEINSLSIVDMPKISNLNVLKGSYVNLEYSLPNGQKTKFLNDNKLYFGNQIPKENSQHCYGIIADENFLLISEYEKDGKSPELILYKKNTH